MHSGSGGNAKVPPLLWECYSVWCNAVDHAQSSGGWPQKWVWGHFGSIWWFMILFKNDTCLIHLHSWSSFVLPEGMNRMKTFSLTCECVIHPWAGGREDIATLGQKTLQPLTNLFSYLAQMSSVPVSQGHKYCRPQPVYLKTGWFVILQWWMHTLFAPGLFLCRWEVSSLHIQKLFSLLDGELQTWPQKSTCCFCKRSIAWVIKP